MLTLPHSGLRSFILICHIVAAMLSVFTSSNSKHCTAKVIIYKAKYVHTAKSKMHISKSQFRDSPPLSSPDFYITSDCT